MIHKNLDVYEKSEEIKREMIAICFENKFVLEAGGLYIRFRDIDLSNRHIYEVNLGTEVEHDS